MDIEKLEEMKCLCYENSENYMEEYVCGKGKRCYIFFSSNGLYEDDKFEQTIIENDRYEWQSIAQTLKKNKEIAKIIYVRDIYKKFYMYGINHELDNIDKIVSKLKGLSEGYDVTTVGISSGGYMAVICALVMNASRAFCFSGQFNLERHLQEEDLKACRAISERSKWVNLLPLLQSTPNVPIYYFCPIGCDHDYNNYQIVKEEKNVKTFLFPDKKHGATVYPFNFPDLLLKSNSKLNKLNNHYYRKIINKNFFYFKTVTWPGFGMFLAYVFKTRFRFDVLKKKWNV